MHFKKISLKKRQRNKKIRKCFKNFFSFFLIIFKKDPYLLIKDKIIKKFNKIKFFLHRQRFTSIIATRRQKNSIIFITSFIMIIVAFLIAFKLSSEAFIFLKNFDSKKILSSLEKKLPQDQNGFFNILFLGIGGKGHDGGKLTDTIILVSIDQKKHNIVMLSIPRDFWVETEATNSRINEILRDAPAYFIKKGFSKEGAVKKSLQTLQEKITEITSLQIHRFAKIDFKGFEKLIDLLEGIDVIVEREINDPSYPDGNWGYEKFYLAKGNHHLDGSKALKYARSRHDSSDFDRSKRQQKLIQAIKEKALKMEILTSTNKLKGILEILKDNFSTDLSWREIITLANLATNLSKDNLFSYVLTDDPLHKGGFLVTPSRDLYGGAFVLVPFLNLVKGHRFDQIKTFSNIIFKYRGLINDKNLQIEIYNATSRQGLARSLMNHLKRYGLKINKIDTFSEKLEQTVIKINPHKEKSKNLANILKRLFAAKIIYQENIITKINQSDLKNNATESNFSAEENQKKEKIIILLGTDFKKPFRIPQYEISTKKNSSQ